MKRINIIRIIIYVIMVSIVTMAIPNAKFNFLTSYVEIKWLYFLIQILIIPLFLEMILYNFLKIIRCIELKDIFSWSNVERFKKISYYVWSIVIMKVIINSIRSIKGDDIDLAYLLIIALFAQLLSRVFLEAYKLRDTEKKLQEENKLII